MRSHYVLHVEFRSLEIEVPRDLELSLPSFILNDVILYMQVICNQIRKNKGRAYGKQYNKNILNNY